MSGRPCDFAPLISSLKYFIWACAAQQAGHVLAYKFSTLMGGLSMHRCTPVCCVLVLAKAQIVLLPSDHDVIS